MSNLDKTNKDLNRRRLNLRDYKVKKVLPEFFQQDYPKLISLLNHYYDFENTDNSPSRLIDELFSSRDITQTDINLLQYIEDELLLGQSYFEGFKDKRSAIKYSNILYRSKGTKYSIQQFFRTFFGIDPEIIYTKEQIFIVGDSKIGSNSQRFLTDDKLYQTFALQIKSELPTQDWEKIYKLFVHPAGMYVGGEVQIVTSFDLMMEDMPEAGEADVPDVEVESFTDIETLAYSQITALTPLDSDNSLLVRSYPNQIKHWPSISLGNLIDQYSNMVEFVEANSPTFDEDHDIDSSGIGFSNTYETFDQEQWGWIDSSDNFYELDEIEPVQVIVKKGDLRNIIFSSFSNIGIGKK